MDGIELTTMQTQQSEQVQTTEDTRSSSPSSNSSISNSVSLIKLDELSSFGATKQSRLPTLIKLTSNELDASVVPHSMPAYSADQMEQPVPQQNASEAASGSLPANVGQLQAEPAVAMENAVATTEAGNNKENEHVEDASADDFQVVDMNDDELETRPMVGPSLPAPDNAGAIQNANDKSPLSSLRNGPLASTQFGDSLIDMIINLRTENQNLVRALETNNDYVKERLDEFKRAAEEAKKHETEFAMERADLEHQVRKLTRQNSVLSERLKSMESKLRDMKLEVSDSLAAALASKASSNAGGDSAIAYPNLEPQSFNAGEQQQQQQQQTNEPTSMQVDATSGELNQQESSESSDDQQQPQQLTKEQLEKRFDAQKAEFYAAADDPMKQCDKLEAQLNEIGKRDYEICLLQQQLNIYRQDFRLERMANLEAKLQIEKLKNDVERLCFERMQEKHRLAAGAAVHSSGDIAFGKLGRRAAKSAAKAARYAAKQAYRDERAKSSAAAAAALAAARANVTASKSAAATEAGATSQPQQATDEQHAGHHHRHGRHHRHRSAIGQVGHEVVNDLLSTANKAMLTGYRMASTHVNLALDKLSQFEQQQAANLAKAKTGNPMPSAPMQHPSID